MTNLNSEQHLGNQPLKNQSHYTGEKLGAIASDIAKTSSGYAKKSKDYMNEHPSRSVAISAAAGAVVGSVLTLALRRRK